MVAVVVSDKKYDSIYVSGQFVCDLIMFMLFPVVKLSPAAF